MTINADGHGPARYFNRIALLALLISGILGAAGVQDQPADASKPAIATQVPATNSVLSELRTIICSINSKASARQGKVTASDFAEDIRAFDALLARHAGEKTDELAKVALIKAMLYGKLLNDKPAATRLEKQLKRDFKGTAFVSRLEREEEGEGEEEDQESLEIGLPYFPDFHVTDIKGGPLSVTQFKGRVVLVYCWASWCLPCVQELPEIVRLYKKHHAAGFEIIGISLDSDRAGFDAFLKSHPDMTWPQYFDGSGWANKVSSKYGIRSMPYGILVNAAGDIVAKGLKGKDLTDAVDTAFNTTPKVSK